MSSLASHLQFSWGVRRNQKDDLFSTVFFLLVIGSCKETCWRIYVDVGVIWGCVAKCLRLLIFSYQLRPTCRKPLQLVPQNGNQSVKEEDKGSVRSLGTLRVDLGLQMMLSLSKSVVLDFWGVFSFMRGR